MDKIIIIVLFIITFTGCASSPSIPDVESILNNKRWNELDSALNNYKPTLHDKLSGIGDKEKTVSKSKATAAFLIQYDICDSARQSSTQDEIINCNKLLGDKWDQIVLLHYPLFSKEFSAVLNGKKDVFVWRIREAEMKKAEVEKQRQEEVKSRRDQERKWEAEADNLYGNVIEQAMGTSEYKIQECSCDICDAIEQKSTSEQVIAHEKKYANQYGVVNLSKIDKFKQLIMEMDSQIAYGKKQYKMVTGRIFDGSQCKHPHDYDGCKENKDRILKKLTLIKLNDQINLIQEQDKKNYLVNYLRNKNAL